MITVASFSKPEEAYLLKMRLGAGGVEAFVQDEYLVQMDWLYSNAIGGVRVQIHEDDVEAAREILGMEAAASATEGMSCPACGSEEVSLSESLSKRGVISLFSWFLIAFPLPFLQTRKTCACGQCNHRWDR